MDEKKPETRKRPNATVRRLWRILKADAERDARAEETRQLRLPKDVA